MANLDSPAVGSESVFKTAYDVPDSAKTLGVSQPMVWKLIRTKKIKSVQIGKRRLIPGTELRRLLTPA